MLFRRFKNRCVSLAIAVVMLMILVAPASAEKIKTFPVSTDGDVFVDVMISSDTQVALLDESVSLNLEGIQKVSNDTEKCTITAVYTLYNNSKEEVTFQLAKPEIMKVKEIELTKDQVEEFDPGVRLTVGEEVIHGSLYAGETVENIMNKSVYSTRQETFYHYTYSTFLNEAMFAFGGKNEDVLSQKYDGLLKDKPQTYYYADEGGVERLCAKVFMITMEPEEEIKIEITQDITGGITRQTKYSREGGSYKFAYNYGGLNSFYSVGALTYVFDDNINVPLMECSAPMYLDDETWTIRTDSLPRSFTFSAGKLMSEKEVGDYNSAFGIGKKLSDVMAIAGYVLVVIAFIAGALTIYRRAKGGIGYRE